ncbi:MAG: Hsp20/alpha crystallin family protein [Minicystis sp.]
MSTETKMSKHDGNKVEKLAERPTYAPPVDIYENKDEILILADVPGVSQDELAIHFDKDELTIEAHRAQTSGDPAFDYKRMFVVPRGIDAERIAASIQNGVLRLTLPKSASMKPRQISVTSA